MRDIRNDLHERANFLAGQIKLAQGQFDKLIEELKLEHDSKLHNLKSDLARRAYGHRDRGSAAWQRSVANKAENQLRPPQPPLQQVQPQQSHSDFLTRKISAVGVR